MERLTNAELTHRTDATVKAYHQRHASRTAHDAPQRRYTAAEIEAGTLQPPTFWQYDADGGMPGDNETECVTCGEYDDGGDDDNCTRCGHAVCDSCKAYGHWCERGVQRAGINAGRRTRFEA